MSITSTDTRPKPTSPANEADRCAQVGHEMRPAAEGRIACICCGVPAPGRGATPGTKGGPS
jgi:hypothetical protein